MPRIAGVEVPSEKKIRVAIGYIYGIGYKNGMDVLTAVGINPEARAKTLTEDELSRLSGYIEDHYIIEGQLRRMETQNIARLKDIKCYRGHRHRVGLPVRGQRTRTNARTRKGPRKTVAGKKMAKAPK